MKILEQNRITTKDCSNFTFSRPQKTALYSYWQTLKTSTVTVKYCCLDKIMVGAWLLERWSRHLTDDQFRYNAVQYKYIFLLNNTIPLIKNSRLYKSKVFKQFHFKIYLIFVLCLCALDGFLHCSVHEKETCKRLFWLPPKCAFVKRQMSNI